MDDFVLVEKVQRRNSFPTWSGRSHHGGLAHRDSRACGSESEGDSAVGGKEWVAVKCIKRRSVLHLGDRVSGHTKTGGRRRPLEKARRAALAGAGVVGMGPSPEQTTLGMAGRWTSILREILEMKLTAPDI